MVRANAPTIFYVYLLNWATLLLNTRVLHIGSVSASQAEGVSSILIIRSD